ncbi:frizzled-3 [Musca vetustissima]|uniref:frizzled-3 n=1 Tax=Musca vetustissima TaxID=27455 RepID=UPI002AB6E61C|nr:frizzled-3 [Musca vetustissima]
MSNSTVRLMALVGGLLLLLTSEIVASKLSLPLTGSNHHHHHNQLTSSTIHLTPNGLQCQRITVSACHGVGYNMTAYPNLAGHTNQMEAELRITKLLPLIESHCSNTIRFLLCSSLFPLCTPDVPRPVTACKSLCEFVKSECSSHTELMQLWPEFLKCEQLPSPEHQELCMQIPTIPTVQQHHLLQTHSGGPSVAMAPPAPAPNHHFYWPWMSQHIISKAIKPTAICPTNFTVNLFNPDECVPQCSRDGFHTTQQKKIAESLILGLSAICFVLTLFSLVTFWAEPTRFGYPERPVLFLCLCYNLFSVCYLERIVFHNSSRAMALMEDPLSKTQHPACSLAPPCLASYITTSYLSLCAATWWLIFALCFYLSSHKKWSSEALEKKSGLFHVLAWVPPLAPPIAALLMEKVKPNELTGMCTAPGFVEIPTMVLLLLGFFFTLRASRSLHALQQQMLPTFGHQRFSQIRKRFLIFSLLFLVPTLAGVVSRFFEPHMDSVPTCSTREDCASPTPLIAWPTLLRLFFQLTGGTLTGMWVWSRKTCESYRSRLVPTPTSSMTNTTTKSAASLPKKHLHTSGKSTIGAPLYSGINFHNVPVYTTTTTIVPRV